MDRTFRVLVVGAGGQLGRALTRATWPESFDVVGVDHGALDIICGSHVAEVVREGDFEAVVNVAAYTAVDEAENKPFQAYAVNQLGAENIARACAAAGAIMVHVSTDYVFDGSKPDPYVEGDTVNPSNVYGLSKAAGERSIRVNLDRHIILRTAWLFSSGQDNFVGKILKLAGQRSELSIISDQLGNPTSADDLAKAIIRIVQETVQLHVGEDEGVWGTYHCANSEYASWHDLANEVIHTARSQLGCRPKILPISTEEYPQAARRPPNSRLDCTKLESAFGIRLGTWRNAIPAIVNEIMTEMK